MKKEMINTEFPSHYFYIVYLKSEQVHSVGDILKLLPVHEQPVKVAFDGLPNATFTYVQIALKRAYGTDSVSKKVDGPQNTPIYLYDLYLGEISTADKQMFFICYPYVKLGKILDDQFKGKVIKKIYKPMVPRVLDYMQNRGNLGLSKVEQNRLNVDITKYSAEVTEEANANRLNISGKNPLNSHVYEILQRDPLIFLKPISLKLRCIVDELGLIELAFDKLGNMKFWLRQNGQQTILSILPTTVYFFDEIKAFKDSPYINSVSLLDDEQ